MAQLVAGAVGAVVGFYVGGPAGAQAGFAIGSALYAVTQPGPHSEGPRLNDLKMTGTDYGQAIPYVVAHPRISGQIVYSSDKREIATTTEQGKGGGASYTEYSYEIDVLFLLTDNPVEGFSRIWDNGKLIYSNLEGASAQTLYASANSDKWTRITFYDGNPSQLPDPTYEAAVGIGRAPAYRGRGSVFIEGLKLGTSGQLPVLTFEIGRKATIGQGALINIPFDNDSYDDVGQSPALTPTVTNEYLISYLEDSRAYFFNAFDVSQGPEIVYAGTKITDATASGEKFTVQCEFTAMGIHGSGTGDSKRIMGLSATSIGAEWRYRIVDSGLHLLTAVTNIATAVVDHGYFGVDVELRIVVNDTPGYVDFYVGTTKVRSTGTLTGYERLNIGHPSPGFGPTAAALDSYIFDYVVGYYGEAPLPTITLQDETVESVVAELMYRCGYEASEFDVSALSTITKPVRSMAIGSIGATRATIELLMQSHYFNCVLSDKLYFRPRATAPTLTIDWDELGASNSPEGDADPLTIKYRNELEVPAQVAVSYINVTDDYQTGTEFSDRAISSQASTTGVQIGLGMTPEEAKGIADALVLDNYASIAGATLKIPFTRNEIEPTDVVTVNGDGESYRMRITGKNDSGGILELEAVIDDVNALLSAQITSDDYEPQTEVQLAANTLWDALDIPLLRDGDNSPGWYVAAKRASDGTFWPGAAVLRSWDGISYDQVASFTSESIFGLAESTLGDWAGGNVFDETNSIQVNVGAGQLSSSTRDAMLSDLTINVMLIGNEVVRFRTATMLSAGVYVLTGLIRGFRGTQWAMTGHLGGEDVVLLTVSGLRNVQTEASQIGIQRYVEAVTFNKPLSSAEPELFTDTGVRLKPFAPTDLRISRDASANIAGTFKRMTRLSFRFLSPGIDPPLGEESELYDVVIYADNTYAVVKRTITVTSQAFSYSAADQTTDFGSTQSTIYTRVYQRSAIVGRGYALQGQG